MDMGEGLRLAVDEAFVICEPMQVAWSDDRKVEQELLEDIMRQTRQQQRPGLRQELATVYCSGDSIAIEKMLRIAQDHARAAWLCNAARTVIRQRQAERTIRQETSRRSRIMFSYSTNNTKATHQEQI